MANSSTINNGSSSNSNGTTTTTVNNGGRSTVPDNSAVGPSELALRHHVSLTVDWTREEQSLLEELLVKYASDSRVSCYAKIAVKLNDKTVRDVALRCRWMNKKENGKQRKDEGTSSRRHRVKRERSADQQAKLSSHATNRGNGFPNAQTSTSMDSDDGFSKKVAADEQLLQQNHQALDQISANFSAFKNGLQWQLYENFNLLSQASNNLTTVWNDSLHDMPQIPKRMPPLHVKIDDYDEILTTF